MSPTSNIKPFLPSSRPSGAVFIGLNAVRALSIIALLLVFAANIETMVSWVSLQEKQVLRLPFCSDIKAIKKPASDEDDCDYIEYSSVPDQTGGPFWSILNRIFICELNGALAKQQLIGLLILQCPSVCSSSCRKSEFLDAYSKIIFPCSDRPMG